MRVVDKVHTTFRDWMNSNDGVPAELHIGEIEYVQLVQETQMQDWKIAPADRRFMGMKIVILPPGGELLIK